MSPMYRSVWPDSISWFCYELFSVDFAIYGIFGENLADFTWSYWSVHTNDHRILKIALQSSNKKDIYELLLVCPCVRNMQIISETTYSSQTNLIKHTYITLSLFLIPAAISQSVTYEICFCNPANVPSGEYYKNPIFKSSSNKSTQNL